MEQRYLTSNGPEVTGQRTTYSWDADPDGGTGGFWAGRLAKIEHGSGLVEKFRYTVAGLTASKSQSLGQTTPLVTPATVDYAYNDEGRPTAIAYPESGFIGTNGAYYPRPRLTLSYSYNASGMLYGVNRADTGLALITNAQYGIGGRLSSVSRPQSLTLDANSLLPTAANDVSDEAYLYNALGQVTSQSWAGVSKQYNFTAGANDGRVSQIVSSPGETVNYTFDSLGRLSTAATASPAWGLSWGYDGFGNRLQQNVTKGTAISVQMSVDPTTNRLLRSDIAYDSNGNLTNWTSAQGTVALTYDIENRVTQVTAPNGVETYDYTAKNQRVVKNYPNNGSLQSKMEVYGAGSDLLGEYNICAITGGQYQGSYALCNPYQRIYFAGRLMLRQTSTPQMTAINTDRLGSAIQTFPYGDTLSTVEPDKESFATYTRDGVDGLDYAQNRYYSSTWGRFLSADPYQASGGAGNPGSWNRYSYVHNDPTNLMDRRGLMAQGPDASSDHIEQNIGGWIGLMGSIWGLYDSWAHHEYFSSPMVSGPDYSREGGVGGGPGRGLGIKHLNSIANGGFQSKDTCQKFLAALGGQASVETLSKQIMQMALAATSYIFDGPSSSTPLSSDAFPGIASPGVRTVGDWFSGNAGAQALSQYSGAAIWLRMGDWEPALGGLVPSSFEGAYGAGTMMHELLHKQGVGGGFSHTQLTIALANVGIAPGSYSLGHNAISDQIGRICF